jgi:hypothetical protein
VLLGLNVMLVFSFIIFLEALTLALVYAKMVFFDFIFTIEKAIVFVRFHLR